jgi:hypothetical protein
MKKNMIRIGIAALLVAALAYGWTLLAPIFKSTPGTDEVEDVEKLKPVGPAFDADSAYAFCQAQCDFGPRAMNTTGHDLCEEWIVSKFRSYGLTVKRQHADLRGYDGTILKATNIMAQYRPELTTRILICAHWDSRPWADNDPDEANWHKPIIAANDAASGVAVMIELARLLSMEEQSGDSTANSQSLIGKSIGVDFLCLDAEDWGTPQWAEDQTNTSDTWALGAQYFAQNMPEGYEARYGILLDMVGGQGAKFYQEGLSMDFAPDIVRKVWRAARQAGYGSYFPKKEGNPITDDHIPLNQHARIPTIDIIPHYPDCRQSSFGPTWHTLADDMQHIDPNTLKAVGQTMVQVLWTEE